MKDVSSPGLKSQEIEFEEQRKTGGREGARSEASASVFEENISQLPTKKFTSTSLT